MLKPNSTKANKIPNPNQNKSCQWLIRITDILVAESKYNRSQLGSTKKGRVKQMSKEWILTKLRTVKKYHSQKNTYTQIINHVKKDNYRAKLFTLKPQKQNNLLIILHNIKNKTATNISKTDKTKIVLNYKHHKSKFAKQMIQITIVV